MGGSLHPQARRNPPDDPVLPMDAHDPAGPGSPVLPALHGLEDPQLQIRNRREQHRGVRRDFPEYRDGRDEGQDSVLHDQADGQVRIVCIPVRRGPNAGLMVGQRCRRWTKINPALAYRLVFTGLLGNYSRRHITWVACFSLISHSILSRFSCNFASTIF